MISPLSRRPGSPTGRATPPPDPTPVDAELRTLRAGLQRQRAALWLRRGVRRAWWAFAAVAVAWVVLLAFARIVPLVALPVLVASVPVVVGAGLLVAVLHARPSLGEAALAVDTEAGLADRVGSALAFAAEPPHGDGADAAAHDAFVARQRRDAVAALARVSPATFRPRVAGRPALVGAARARAGGTSRASPERHGPADCPRPRGAGGGHPDRRADRPRRRAAGARGSDAVGPAVAAGAGPARPGEEPPRRPRRARSQPRPPRGSRGLRPRAARSIERGAGGRARLAQPGAVPRRRRATRVPTPEATRRRPSRTSSGSPTGSTSRRATSWRGSARRSRRSRAPPGRRARAPTRPSATRRTPSPVATSRLRPTRCDGSAMRSAAPRTGWPRTATSAARRRSSRTRDAASPTPVARAIRPPASRAQQGQPGQGQGRASRGRPGIPGQGQGQGQGSGQGQGQGPGPGPGARGPGPGPGPGPGVRAGPGTGLRPGAGLRPGTGLRPGPGVARRRRVERPLPRQRHRVRSSPRAGEPEPPGR